MVCLCLTPNRRLPPASGSLHRLQRFVPLGDAYEMVRPSHVQDTIASVFVSSSRAVLPGWCPQVAVGLEGGKARSRCCGRESGEVEQSGRESPTTIFYCCWFWRDLLGFVPYFCAEFIFWFSAAACTSFVLQYIIHTYSKYILFIMICSYHT